MKTPEELVNDVAPILEDVAVVLRGLSDRAWALLGTELTRKFIDQAVAKVDEAALELRAALVRGSLQERR